MRVLVLGCGPAGCSVALSSPPEVEVHLYDVFGSPRSACAGGLGLWAMREVEGYGPVFASSMYSATRTYVEELEILGERAKLSLRAEDYGLKYFAVVMDRSAFDRALLDRALSRENVTRVESKPDASGYDLVVDARGMSSLPDLKDEDVELLVQAYLEVEDVEPKITLAVWKDMSRTGYFWEFPEVQSGRLKVGFGMSVAELKQRRVGLRDVLHKYVERRGLRGRVVKYDGGRLPLTKPKLQHLFGSGMVRVGTAACLVDPLTGAGIRYAIRSGTALAETGFDARGYARAMKPTLRELGKRYWMKRLFCWISQRTFDKLLKVVGEKVKDLDLKSLDLEGIRVVRKFPFIAF